MLDVLICLNIESLNNSGRAMEAVLGIAWIGILLNTQNEFGWI